MTTTINNDVIIGIDLGTTFSCVGVYKNGKVEIIANETGTRTVPSYVSFSGDERLVGASAKNQANYNPSNTVYDAKRLIGRKYDDVNVRNSMKHWSFTVQNDKNNKPVIAVLYKGEKCLFTPEEISAMILTKMKETAETYLGHPVSKAVITVPAYFNDAQRTATRDAGVIAGLNVVRIINEPTAAAMAYGLDKTKEANVMIFDLGGGTLDVSVLNIDDGVFHVKAVAGNTFLGGEDFDNELVKWTLEEFYKLNKHVNISDVLQNKKTLRKLKTVCEKAKHNLSSALFDWIEVESLYDGIDFRIKITRAKFDDICAPLFNKCFEPIEQTLKDSKLDKTQIDDVVLVGGSTRIPKIVDMLREYFGKEPKRDINPDEAVAYGASIQGGILSNLNDEKLDKLVLVDVTPLSLGIETAGGIMCVLIPRNQTLPFTHEEVFSTFSDNQPGVTVKVFEGESELTKRNNLLGTFELTGIPPLPRGVPKITVKFDINANGILQVSALEKSSGKEQKIVIKNDNNRFSKDEISKFVEKAKEFEADDKAFKAKTEAKMKVENYLYSVRNSLEANNISLKLGEEQIAKISKLILEGLQFIDTVSLSTVEEYNNKYTEYTTQITPILESVYKK